MASVGNAGVEGTSGPSAWWLQIVPVVVGLGGFGAYATFRAFEGAYFQWGPYLSPFYSPLIDVHHHYWPFSPALLILVGPLSFRLTCYYYRKAYYCAFFLDPPACSVAENPSRRYGGETCWPLLNGEMGKVHTCFIAIYRKPCKIWLAFFAPKKTCIRR